MIKFLMGTLTLMTGVGVLAYQNDWIAIGVLLVMMGGNLQEWAAIDHDN